MKFSRHFQILLFLTLILLYGTGVLKWVLGLWFQVDQGFGLQPTGFETRTLQTHSIVGLWFLVLFGYIFHSHVKRGWTAKMKIKSGLFLILPLILVMLTVPGLFYLGDEKIKFTVAQVHIYLGLVLVLPFLVHLLTPSALKIRSRRNKNRASK